MIFLARVAAYQDAGVIRLLLGVAVYCRGWRWCCSVVAGGGRSGRERVGGEGLRGGSERGNEP